jgi:hypothetical protein
MCEKNRLKGERAWFLHERQRRANPETEPLSPDLWPVQWIQISGESKGLDPLGRKTLHGVRDGEAESRKRSEASVGRGKAQLFLLQGFRRGKRGVFLESISRSILKEKIE